MQKKNKNFSARQTGGPQVWRQPGLHRATMSKERERPSFSPLPTGVMDMVQLRGRKPGMAGRAKGQKGPGHLDLLLPERDQCLLYKAIAVRAPATWLKCNPDTSGHLRPILQAWNAVHTYRLSTEKWRR